MVCCIRVVLAFVGVASVAAAQDVAVLCESAKLVSPRSGIQDQLGYSLDIDGDTLLTGSPHPFPAGTFPGWTFAFSRENGKWTEEARFTGSDSAASDFFGFSVGVSGGTAVIGVRKDDVLFIGPFVGSLYIFERQGDEWIEKQKLLTEDAAPLDQFGHSVAIEGDTLVGGATMFFADGPGAAYVFERQGMSWEQAAKLEALDGAPRDFLGASVSLSGDTIVVGAPCDDDAGDDSGSAYVFLRQGTQWVQQAKLSPNDGEELANFGNAVSVFGDTAVVGAPGSAGTGGAYVFQRTGTVWQFRQKLLPPDAVGEERFGASVAIHDGNIAVGADEASAFEQTGRAYAFTLDGSTWRLRAKLLASDGADLDSFGHAVAVQGEEVYVSARREDTPVTNSGAIYLFRLPPTTTASYCSGKVSSLGCEPFVCVSGVPSVSDANPFLIGASQVIPSNYGILFYGFGKADIDFHGGTWCVSAPLHKLVLQFAESGGSLPCTGVFSRNFNHRIQAQSDPMLSAGTQVFAQVRQRDPGDPFGFNDSLSNAVTFVIQP